MLETSLFYVLDYGKNICCILYCGSFMCAKYKCRNIIWKIGKADNSASELALGPSSYKDFLAKDFGYEDRYFLIGNSKEDKDFPYVLPGPNDVWGGTWRTSGWRTHSTNILFGLDRMQNVGNVDWLLICWMLIQSVLWSRSWSILLKKSLK